MTALLESGSVRLEADDSVLKVEGQVGFDAATALAETGRDWLAEQPAGSRVTFDLSGVADVSSAAFSVLLEWARAARTAGLELQAVRLSPALRRLADLAGLERLLPVESAAA
ncbi:MAG: STAS domain-containing protein [Halomonas sp.]|uniref:STAS domain-containing protein n=1 Tax=Halomonas sp. TaxID=1486246 RepID=UPI0019EE9066|nr:STAS domain-containing protein [Halomonas sp.]MBE0488897.1 STAS domain-containing protein [Halomonas sp.]